MCFQTRQLICKLEERAVVFQVVAERNSPSFKLLCTISRIRLPSRSLKVTFSTICLLNKLYLISPKRRRKRWDFKRARNVCTGDANFLCLFHVSSPNLHVVNETLNCDPNKLCFFLFFSNHYKGRPSALRLFGVVLSCLIFNEDIFSCVS